MLQFPLRQNKSKKHVSSGSRWGGGALNLLLLDIIFAENCMKIN